MLVEILGSIDCGGSGATALAAEEVVGERAVELFFQPGGGRRRYLVLGGIDGNVLPAVLCSRTLALGAALVVASHGADRVDRASARLDVFGGRAVRHLGVC